MGCSVCGGDHPSTKHMPSVKRLDTRYRIEYVEHKELVRLLQDAHDYAAANEHRADYWTCMAAYLAAEGLIYRYTPPKGPLCLHDGTEDTSDCIHAIHLPTE